MDFAIKPKKFHHHLHVPQVNIVIFEKSPDHIFTVRFPLPFISVFFKEICMRGPHHNCTHFTVTLNSTEQVKICISSSFLAGVILFHFFWYETNTT